MKAKRIVIGLAFLLAGFSAVFAAQPPELVQKNEKLLRDQIARDTKSEQSRYEYAHFLYSEKRFQEADEQLDQLFLLNPAHEGGKRLQASIEQIQKLADPNQIEEAMTSFVFSDLDHSFQDMEAVLNAPREKPLREQAANKPVSYQTTLEEIQYISLIEKTVAQADQETVLKEFDEARRKFPDSPDVEVRHLSYLIDKGMVGKAEELLPSSRGKYPDSLEIQAIERCVSELKAAKSTEQTAKAKETLLWALMDISGGKLDRIMKKTDQTMGKVESQKAPDS